MGEFDLKALLLPAVNVDPGCCNSELLLLFNCLEANGSEVQTWTLKTSIFVIALLQTAQTG